MAGAAHSARGKKRRRGVRKGRRAARAKAGRGVRALRRFRGRRHRGARGRGPAARRRRTARATPRRGRDPREALPYPPDSAEPLPEELVRALNADTHSEELGVNLIGYARSETGVGESCRLAARALASAGLPFGLLSVDVDRLDNADISWAHKELRSPKYGTNVFHINAAGMPDIVERFGESLFRDRFNVGYWHWELPEFPDEYLSGLERLDEIWVPTRFVRDSIAAKTRVPTIVIPHGIHVEALPEHLDRAWFGLPADRFLFLCMYDSYSIQERKNPQGVIEAYRRLTASGGLPVELVVKINHANERETAELRERLEGVPNVRIIDEVLGCVETKALIRGADCLVSLHRSEGFGLPLAEAMFLGKPVIGTNWSGNTDFMNPGNAGAVNYRLVRLGQDYGPYRAHQHWAEPDLDHAVYLMRRMASDRHWREQIARNGQATIRAQFSPQTTGNLIKERLKARRGGLQTAY